MRKTKHLTMKMSFLTAWIMILLLAVPLSACASGGGNQAAVTRLDDDGYLYYMDYTKDYYGPDVIDAMRKVGYIDHGCSVFITHNPEGELISCRNYDAAHRMSPEDSTMTGLNVVIHCKPEGKYESIAVADAVWCDETNPLLWQGGPDREGFSPGLMDILPYECSDGMNEKGLFVSAQQLDIKEGDQPARFPAGSTMLLRYILDDCADVDEAVRKTETGILEPADWQDCHLMVSDATGRSVVIESRNSKVTVIPSEICTNFYLGSDDMEDSYKDGKLREEAIRITDENNRTDFQYGYGHGYHRFAVILGQLECYRDTTGRENDTVMPESIALVILRSVAQNPYTAASGASMTQYSAIYNNGRKTVEVWPFQNYSRSYKFDVKGNRIPTDP